MKTLALLNGDLVAGAGGHATITGTSKVRQDLSLLLGERWGTDRFHGDQWGSTVTDFIGQPLSADLEVRVREEVARAISQYIAIQTTEIYRDRINGTRSRFATSDVVRQVDSIEVTPRYDSIRIAINLVTQAGIEVQLNRTVTI